MAFGLSTVQAFGGAVSDLLSSQATEKGLRLKAQGNVVEAGNYTAAAQLALENEEYTKQSTEIQQTQSERATLLGIGKEKSDIAGAGFAESGTGLDLLRSAAIQGGLQKAVIGQQGLIQEDSQAEQATAYENLAKYATYASDQENEMAGDARNAGQINAGVKALTGFASLFLK